MYSCCCGQCTNDACSARCLLTLHGTRHACPPPTYAARSMKAQWASTPYNRRARTRRHPHAAIHASPPTSLAPTRGISSSRRPRATDGVIGRHTLSSVYSSRGRTAQCLQSRSTRRLTSDAVWTCDRIRNSMQTQRRFASSSRGSIARGWTLKALRSSAYERMWNPPRRAFYSARENGSARLQTAC